MIALNYTHILPVEKAGDWISVSVGKYDVQDLEKVMSEKVAVIQTPVSPGWRPKVGLFLFILALASPLLAPLVLATDLPREVKASVAGLLLFGVPMALMLAVVAFVGQRVLRNRKAGFSPRTRVGHGSPRGLR